MKNSMQYLDYKLNGVWQMQLNVHTTSRIDKVVGHMQF